MLQAVILPNTKGALTMATAYFELRSGNVLETDTPRLWETDPNAKKLSRKEGKRRLEEEARAYLLHIIKPGDTVYTVLRHVSSSGMSRNISLFVMRDGQPCCIDGSALHLGIGHRPRGNNQGLQIGGCGMDMGFALVYNLSRVLFHNNFECTGENCPSNDHTNGDRNREPHQHSDGGYALRHRWM